MRGNRVLDVAEVMEILAGTYLYIITNSPDLSIRSKSLKSLEIQASQTVVQGTER